MIIESIRLRNIKSYGEGPDGNGVLIHFDSGCNRVAGRNGCGKTTIIESLGYALFLAEPEFEENFQMEIYFLSHGAKEGLIEVTLNCGGESYSIERPIGKMSKLRSKVVQLSDGSICAEDKEVPVFICRLLDIPDCAHLSEIFSKLIGVKQGRLSLPFDSKPADAKRYFEPLFGVAVFRDCFDRLKEATDIFAEQRATHLQKFAAAETLAKDRADSPEKLKIARQTSNSIQQFLVAATKEFTAADEVRIKLEAAEQHFRKTEQSQISAKQTFAHSTELRKVAEKEVADAQAALGTIRETSSAFQAHTEALVALKGLEKKRENRDALKEQRGKTFQDATSEKQRADAAREQFKEFSEQRAGREKEASGLAEQVKTRHSALTASVNHFKKVSEDADVAGDHCELLSGWVDGLKASLSRQQRTADTISTCASKISAWDEAKLQTAHQAENAALENLRSTEQRHAAATQQHATLQQQLAQIQGGVCPFLKESCRQFDAGKIKSDLAQNARAVATLASELATLRQVHTEAIAASGKLRAAGEEIKRLRQNLAESIESYKAAHNSLKSPAADDAIEWLKKWDSALGAIPHLPTTEARDSGIVSSLHNETETFVKATTVWWSNAHAVIKTRLKKFREEEKTRHTEEQSLQLLQKRLNDLASETQGIAKKAEAKSVESSKHDAQAQIHSQNLSELDENLKTFAALNDELTRERRERDQSQEGHNRYLSAKKLADDLDARQQRLTDRKTAEATAQSASEQASKALDQARLSFDPEKLIAARNESKSKNDAVTTLRVKLDHAIAEFRKEETRIAEWSQACQERDAISKEIARTDAALLITDLARKTLRDTAPAVAQRLCDRIAIHAQRVFNQINPEPIELSWDAERYSLRITPGDRRFAMLSGGEQTKLALAVTLAMIEEFSSLDFCVFDEPTYGVDADSRDKLADAILQARKAAGLQQLLLVSHDEIFEDKNGHAILLEKSIATGTRVVS